uniref:Peptidase_M1 domain-containing protein n=1 Tax=Macrostomum lignano TaxID=282301 RepID=A0A1I8IRA6_9PLAT
NHTRPDTACGPEAVGGCYRDVFDESVVMSTYLVAFAILPLDYGSLTREVPTKYGSVKTLEKQNVAEVITHEIAHQWFGNIVTMTWWDDLWLNEAFATFTQFIGVDVYNPTWNMMDRCYVEFVMNALQTDSMLHSHPIIMAGVSDPSEIESLFDDISYFKGSSLIRMLEGVIGRRVLKEGLMIYLNRFAWRNAASKDLFEAFSEAYRKINQNSGAHSNSPAENLTRVMDTWTTQVNYPLVTVRISGNRLHFRQERFLLYPNGTQIWESHQTNHVPDRQNPEPMWTWLDLEESKTVELDHTPAFVKINLNQTGLYRCNYEFSNWQQLVKLSRQGYFGSTDMAGLLNDAFTLAYIGRLNISVPFDLFETLEEDRLDSGTPWTISMRKISELQPLMAQDQQSAEKLVKLIFKILFDQGQIRQTDAITIAVKFARRSGALDLVWTHFTRNWDQLLKIYGHMPFLMSDITKFPADYYTEFDYERTREFFETHSLTSGKRNAYQSLESIRANIAWIKHNMESFKTFIKNKVIE